MVSDLDAAAGARLLCSSVILTSVLVTGPVRRKASGEVVAYGQVLELSADEAARVLRLVTCQRRW